MLSQSQLNHLGNMYLNELKSKGRKFNPIRFELKSRKASTIYGTAYYSYKKLGYDRITINRHMPDFEELKNTILHELAHLDKEARGHGHGPKWKQVAKLYGQWFNTDISRTGEKEIKIPGRTTIKVQVVWTDKCLRMNKHLPREYTRTYTSMGYAKNFVKKYTRNGFIDSYKIIEEKA